MMARTVGQFKGIVSDMAIEMVSILIAVGMAQNQHAPRLAVILEAHSGPEFGGQDPACP
jgi:hypothetical protein